MCRTFRRLIPGRLLAVLLAVLPAAALALFPAGGAALAAGAPPVVSSERLIELANRYDGKLVSYAGEVVGDILKRGSNAWVTVNDDHYSKRSLKRYAELKGGNAGIGVYCTREQLERVRFLGSYGTVGDLVEITGTFYRANQEFGGDLCIVADRIIILREGYRTDEDRYGAVPYIALALAALSAWAALLLVKRRGPIGA